MTFSVMTVMTIARKNVETTAKNQLAVTSMVARRVDQARSTRSRPRSMIPSIGRDQDVDPERRADAGEARPPGRPAGAGPCCGRRPPPAG